MKQNNTVQGRIVMSKKLYMLVGEIMFFFLLIIVTNVSVHASVMDGPNVGEYIYEQHEILTQDQYSKINDINNQLQTGNKRQRLYVVILDNDPQKPDASDRMYQYLGIKYNDEYAAKILQKWCGNQEYDDRSGDSMLVLYRNQGRIGFIPSGDSSIYLTDYKFWKLTFGKMNGVKTNTVDTQIDTLISISDKLVRPMLYSVNEKHASSSNWRIVNGEFIAGLIISGAIIFILILFIALGYNPAGADYTPDSYDNGFYDGYSYSNSQNDDDNSEF